MDWFRMYHEFATDPKVQSMSEPMQRRLVMLLCLRCSNTLVTLHDDEIAFAMRISDDELASTKELFMRKSFINDAWEILQWDQRQFVSDSSAPRVARHRAAKKEAAKSLGNDDVTGSNVTETSQIQNRYRTDTEQKEPIAPETGIPASPKKSRAANKTPLPNGFQISERVRTWAAEKNHNNLDRHFENFVGSAKARGYTYADWDEALMNAIRNDWAKLGKQVDSSAPSHLGKSGQVTAANAKKWLETQNA